LLFDVWLFYAGENEVGIQASLVQDRPYHFRFTKIRAVHPKSRIDNPMVFGKALRVLGSHGPAHEPHRINREKFVGGKRHTAAITPRSNIPGNPCTPFAAYIRVINGTRNKTMIPQTPMPNSNRAYTLTGCFAAEINRGNNKLPKHIPPMNVPSSTPSEIADEPTTSCSN